MAKACTNCKVLINKMHSTLDSFVEAISLLMDYRDPYTSGHQRRVSQLSCAIAKKMRMPDERIDCIKIAAGLHDIGKIRVPSEILATPTKLCSSEFEILKMHPQVGYDILKNVDFTCTIDATCGISGKRECLLPQIIKEHHEKMDGSGYPTGKKSVLEEARIISIADVVEAMISHRPYRPAPGLDKALVEISINKGKKYWDKAVDACIKVFNNGFSFMKNGKKERIKRK